MPTGTIIVMGQIKSLPASEVMRVTGITCRRSKKVVWHTADIVVLYSLSLQSYVDTINSIINDCTNGDGDCVVPFVDFSIRANIIRSYSNAELPDDQEKLFDVIYAYDLFETVYKNANSKQIDTIVQTVYRVCR